MLKPFHFPSRFLAGTTTVTNFSYTLSYAGVTNAPALTLLWPPDNTPIGGSNVTIQAQVSDATATVAATVNGSTVQGLIERSGLVWLQNLPLNGGTNVVTITSQNAAGKVSTNTLDIVESSVSLGINPISSGQLNKTNVTVTGTIGNSSYGVWVNGVRAGVSSGLWSAANVPVSPSGTAVVTVEAGTDTSDIVTSQTMSQPQPAVAVIASYANVYRSSSTYIGWACGPTVFDDVTEHWVSGDGSDQEYGSAWTGTCEYPPFDYGSTTDLSGYTNNLPVVWAYADMSDGGYGYAAAFSMQTTLTVKPSGQQATGGTSLYLVEASAMEYSDVDDAIEGDAGDVPVAPEWVAINGQNLQSTGITNEDGSVMGLTVVSGPSGTPVPLTPTTTQFYSNHAASFNAKVFQLVSQCVATTPSDRARTNLGVGEQVSLSFYPALPTTNVSWSATGGGLAVTNNSLTNLFTAPDNATNVTVTATIGSLPVKFYFKVFAPTGAVLENIPGTLTTSTNPLGVFCYAYWYVKPDSVSFYNVKIAEGFTNATATGYFDSVCHWNNLLHTPGPPLEGNDVISGKGTQFGSLTFADHVTMPTLGTPYSNGTFVWHIPWSYITPDGKTNYFTTVDHFASLNTTSTNGGILLLQKQGAGGSVTNNY